MIGLEPILPHRGRTPDYTTSQAKTNISLALQK